MYGHLTLICGPMYAGKTTELLKRILWARKGQNKRVLVVKPAFDDRYALTEIVSHDGLRVEAQSISSWDQIEGMASAADLVCIDEVQFFTDPHFDGDIVEIIRGLLKAGQSVLATGLDMDWRGYPFASTASLGAMADELVKITANCTVCGRPAVKTFKKSGDGESVELGAFDKYEARCNEHWH